MHILHPLFHATPDLYPLNVFESVARCHQMYEQSLWTPNESTTFKEVLQSGGLILPQSTLFFLVPFLFRSYILLQVTKVCMRSNFSNDGMVIIIPVIRGAWWPLHFQQQGIDSFTWACCSFLTTCLLSFSIINLPEWWDHSSWIFEMMFENVSCGMPAAMPEVFMFRGSVIGRVIAKDPHSLGRATSRNIACAESRTVKLFMER